MPPKLHNGLLVTQDQRSQTPFVQRTTGFSYPSASSACSGMVQQSKAGSLLIARRTEHATDEQNS